MNDFLKEYLDLVCAVYIDHKLNYSDTLAEHKIHVRKVLTTVRGNRVLLNSEKCQFHTKTIKYLGFNISLDGISMDMAKSPPYRNVTPQNT